MVWTKQTDLFYIVILYANTLQYETRELSAAKTRLYVMPHDSWKRNSITTSVDNNIISKIKKRQSAGSESEAQEDHEDEDVKMCWAHQDASYVPYIEYYRRRISRHLHVNKTISQCKVLCTDIGLTSCRSFQYYFSVRQCTLSTLSHANATALGILRRVRSVTFFFLHTCATGNVECGVPIIPPDMYRYYRYAPYMSTSQSYPQSLHIPNITRPGLTQLELFGFDPGQSNGSDATDYENYDDLTSTTNPNLGNIVGGTIARSGSWPWQVQIKLFDRQWCGGSIINEYWVLTAAHCFQQRRYNIEAEQITVHAGSQRRYIQDKPEQIRNAVELIIHPKFDMNRFNKDIALVKLDKPLSFISAYVKPVCIPTNRMRVIAGTECFVTGFGDTQDDYDHSLKQAVVPILYRRRCISKIPFTKYQICAGYRGGGHDACQGDSGGPLVCKYHDRWYQFGIVSYGEGCGLPGKPGFYTRVSKFYNWVQGLINDD